MYNRLSSLLFASCLGLLATLALAIDVQEKPPPLEFLYGEWEVVEMIYRGTVQDFQGQSGGWFTFEPGAFIRVFDAKQRDAIVRDKGLRKIITRPCTIRPREIDIVRKLPGGKEEMLLRALFEFKDRDLRIIWFEESDSERPTHFDALKDPRLTYFLLKKVK